MNISFTPDDVVAASTVGGIVLTPIVAYVRFVHSQQAAAWKSIDKLKEDVANKISREDHEKFRLELKADLAALEARILTAVKTLRGPS